MSQSDGSDGPNSSQATTPPSGEDAPRKPSKFEIYKELRSEVTYEAGLITSRTGWFVSSQSFLFTSLAAGAAANKAEQIQASLLYPLVPICGIILCFLNVQSVEAAIKRAKNISAHINKDYGPFVYGNLIQEDKQITGQGSMSAKFTPYVFAGAWIWIVWPSIRAIIMK